MKAVKPQWPPCFTATAGLAASMNRVLREFVSGQWWHKSSIQHCRVGLRPFLLCLPHWLAVPAGGTTVVAYWCWWQYKYWWWRWQETEAWNYNPDDQSVMLNVFSLSRSFFLPPAVVFTCDSSLTQTGLVSTALWEITMRCLERSVGMLSHKMTRNPNVLFVAGWRLSYFQGQQWGLCWCHCEMAAPEVGVGDKTCQQPSLEAVKGPRGGS